jgi:hypothetical protein
MKKALIEMFAYLGITIFFTAGTLKIIVINFFGIDIVVVLALLFLAFLLGRVITPSLRAVVFARKVGKEKPSDEESPTK